VIVDLRNFLCLRSFFLAILLLSPSSLGAHPAPDGFADLAERLTPAVVNISTTQEMPSAGGIQGGSPFGQKLPEGHPLAPFNELFRQFGNPKLDKRKATSLGSGFVIDPEGYVVTNSHVVDKASSIQVIFGDDSEYEAELIGRDAKTDLALLKIEADKPLPYVSFGDSDNSRVGDWILAIGNPFGLGGTVTTGIISARARDINSGPFDDYIQTDAAINRGNSGGPMFDMDGKVIGINTAIFSPSGGSVGIGFAVPSSLAEPIIKQLKDSGKVERGWVGVLIQHVSDDFAEGLGLEEAKGALIAEVVKDGPADEAGFKVGDVVISFNGKPINEMKKLPRLVAETKIGSTVPVIVWRDGEEVTLQVVIAVLDEGKEEKVISSINKKDKGIDESQVVLGMEIKPLSGEIRKRYSIGKDVKGGAIISVDPNSVAAERGIQKGDVIVSSGNQQRLESASALQDLIDKAEEKGRKSVLLLISRGGSNLFIALPLK